MVAIPLAIGGSPDVMIPLVIDTLVILPVVSAIPVEIVAVERVPVVNAPLVKSEVGVAPVDRIKRAVVSAAVVVPVVANAGSGHVFKSEREQEAP